MKRETQEGFTVCLMDLKTKQIGCVLLQAAYGGSQELAYKVGHEHWFVSTTPDMALYNIPNDEIPKIIEYFKKLSERKKEAAKNELKK